MKMNDVTHIVPDEFRVSFSDELGEAKIRWYVGDKKFALRMPIEQYEALATPEGAVLPRLTEVESGTFKLDPAALVPLVAVVPEGADLA
jgi:hypothetical protein